MAARAKSSSFLAAARPLIAARIFGAALTFVVPLVLARTLSLDDYGTWKQIFLVAQTLFFVLPLGMSQSLYYFVPRGQARREFVSNALLFSLAMGVLALGALLGTADGIAEVLGNPAVARYGPQLAIFAAGLVAAYPLEATLTAHGRTAHAALVHVASDVSRAAGIFVAVLLTKDLGTVMWVVAVHSALRVVIAWVVALRLSGGASVGLREFRWQIAYAAPFGFAIMLEVFQASFHQYVVSASVPPAVFAIYAVGCFQPPVAEMLHTPVSEVLMVHLAKGAPAASAFREAVARLAYVLWPITGFMVVAAPEIIGALFGARFADAVPLLRISAFVLALEIFPLDAVLRARGKTKRLLGAYAVKVLVGIPVTLWLVRHYGLFGGVASWVAVDATGKAILYWNAARMVGGLALPWRDLACSAGALIAGGLAVAAVRSFGAEAIPATGSGFIDRGMPLLVASAVFVAGWGAALRIAGIPLSAILPVERAPAAG